MIHLSVSAVAKQIQEEPKVETKKQKSPIKVFQDCIAQNDLDKALQFVNTGNIPSTILSSLLPALMRKNRVSEAFSVIKTISDRGDYVNVQALKPLYKNLGEAVDYETLCELRRILPGVSSVFVCYFLLFETLHAPILLFFFLIFNIFLD